VGGLNVEDYHTIKQYCFLLPKQKPEAKAQLTSGLDSILRIRLALMLLGLET